MDSRRKPEGAFRRAVTEEGTMKMGLRRRRRGSALLCLLLAFLLIVSGCGQDLTGDGQGKDGETSQSGYTLNEFYFDTVISIKFDSDESGEKLVEGCREICDDIQMTFSRTDEKSELYAVNHRDTDRVEVSEPLAYLVQVGLDYYEISKGRFDITVAPLSDLWDFKSENPSVPSEAQIQSALRKVDAGAVHVECEGCGAQNEDRSEDSVSIVKTKTETETEARNETKNGSEGITGSESKGKTGNKAGADTHTETEIETDTETEAETETIEGNTSSKDTSVYKTEHSEGKAVEEDSTEMDSVTQSENEDLTESDSGEQRWFLRFDSEDTMIDLGALVKGYAADRLAEYLKENGVSSGLINLGGNVYALGSKSDGTLWKVGIQKPFDTGVVDTVEVKDMSVVSSGVYERCFEKDGVLYHHILDPKTGYPVSNGLWGVSIISDSSLTGDALSTTCLAIGIQEAGDLVRSMEGVRAIFVDDHLQVIEVE